MGRQTKVVTNSVNTRNIIQCQVIKIPRGRMSNFRILQWLLHLNSEDKEMFPRPRTGGRVLQPESKSKHGKGIAMHSAYSG